MIDEKGEKFVVNTGHLKHEVLLCNLDTLETWQMKKNGPPTHPVTQVRSLSILFIIMDSSSSLYVL